MPVSLALAGAACLLVVARCAAHQQHPIRGVLGGALCGVAALAALALLAPYTGVQLPFNQFTGFVGAVLGLPGVVLLLILNLIF